MSSGSDTDTTRNPLDKCIMISVRIHQLSKMLLNVKYRFLMYTLIILCQYCLLHLSVCMSVCLSVCLPACLPDCLPACLPVCLSVCLFISWAVCMFCLSCLSLCTIALLATLIWVTSCQKYQTNYHYHTKTVEWVILDASNDKCLRECLDLYIQHEVLLPVIQQWQWSVGLWTSLNTPSDTTGPLF